MHALLLMVVLTYFTVNILGYSNGENVGGIPDWPHFKQIFEWSNQLFKILKFNAYTFKIKIDNDSILILII